MKAAQQGIARSVACGARSQVNAKALTDHEPAREGDHGQRKGSPDVFMGVVAAS